MILFFWMAKCVINCPNYNYQVKSTTSDHHRGQHKTTPIKLTIQLSGLKVFLPNVYFSPTGRDFTAVSAPLVSAVYEEVKATLCTLICVHTELIFMTVQTESTSSASACQLGGLWISQPNYFAVGEPRWPEWSRNRRYNSLRGEFLIFNEPASQRKTGAKSSRSSCRTLNDNKMSQPTRKLEHRLRRWWKLFFFSFLHLIQFFIDMYLPFTLLEVTF